MAEKVNKTIADIVADNFQIYSQGIETIYNIPTKGDVYKKEGTIGNRKKGEIVGDMVFFRGADSVVKKLEMITQLEEPSTVHVPVLLKSIVTFDIEKGSYTITQKNTIEELEEIVEKDWKSHLEE